ncbi:MAG: NAD(P)/FAD-dependent oxidoreductase [Actinomycetota bacterium]|nr:NAD(P)/FAD-dependent oxidoreductase [Actinomycetota bacterium]
MTEAYDVVIIGGGPGGLTAALVLSRARRRVLLVDDGTYRNLQVPEFHGFPGRDATAPSQFRADVVKELGRYDVEMTAGPATSASRDTSMLRIGLPDRTVESRRLVLGTGVVDELPAVPGLAERWGRTVVNCPFCDGWEHRDRPVVVVGAAEGAEDLANMLRSWTSQVTLIAVEEVRALVGDGEALEGVERTDGSVVEAEAVFLRAPMRPRSQLALALGCEVDDWGFIQTSATCMTTDPAVWAVGDVRRRPPAMPHQVVLAAADGAQAAIDIHKSLLSD